MKNGFAILLTFQWIGEVLARLLELPVPGPVLGMALLLFVLMARGRRGLEVPSGLERASAGLLEHLSLLFVPAGVGVLVHLEQVEAAAVPLAASVLLGTLAALAVTGLLAQRVLGRTAS